MFYILFDISRGDMKQKKKKKKNVFTTHAIIFIHYFLGNPEKDYSNYPLFFIFAFHLMLITFDETSVDGIYFAQFLLCKKPVDELLHPSCLGLQLRRINEMHHYFTVCKLSPTLPPSALANSPPIPPNIFVTRFLDLFNVIWTKYDINKEFRFLTASNVLVYMKKIKMADQVT